MNAKSQRRKVAKVIARTGSVGLAAAFLKAMNDKTAGHVIDPRPSSLCAFAFLGIVIVFEFIS